MRTTGQGQLIAGRFRLEEQVGAGGMGVVWRAVDEKLGRVVAVKRAARPAGDERARRQMRREARIAARLNHPHVVAFIDEVIEGPERWLVMEYVPSQSLAQILDRSGPLSLHQVTHIGAQIASALEAVHATDIVHRDVKPGNILVSDNGTAKLADFGIARPICGDVTVTDSGVIGGTVAFIASEVANGQEATPASDVFALGATLFAAVEGTPPFGTADNPLLVLRRAAAGDLLPFHRAGPLAPVLSALLQPDPAKRPDAASTRKMLQELAATSTGGEVAWPVEDAHRPRRSRRRALATAGGCVTALAAVAGLLVFRPERSTPASPPVVLGDPRTADPCALTDAATLARFSNGTIRHETAFGNFNRCDDILTLSGGSRVLVKVEFDKPEPPQGTMKKVGAFSVFRQPEKGGSCDRTVPLADHNLVTVTTELRTNRGPVDLCAIAEAVTGHVVAVLTGLGKGAIPRRAAPPDAASLARMDACALLDASTITRVLGAGASGPKAGFGNWECRWNSGTSGLSVLLAFDRNRPLTERKAGHRQEVSGYAAYIVPESDEQDCIAQVVYRLIVDGNGKRAYELLKILVKGPQTPLQLCGPAEDLAATAAAKLPPSR
ncbi:MAG: serine/threonine-protein kinase [Pseudonocardiaceae bacterium]